MSRWTDSSGRAYAEITTMPGSPFTCIIHAAYVDPYHRRQGIGSQAHQERLHAARQMGYTFAICFADKNNDAEEKILKKWGWRQCDAAYNPATDHILNLWVRDLQLYIPPIQGTNT